jgi:hypothetical protein
VLPTIEPIIVVIRTTCHEIGDLFAPQDEITIELADQIAKDNCTVAGHLIDTDA